MYISLLQYIEKDYIPALVMDSTWMNANIG